MFDFEGARVVQGGCEGAWLWVQLGLGLGLGLGLVCGSLVEHAE